MNDMAGTDYGFVMCRLRSRADINSLENALCGKTNVYTTGVTLPFDEETIDRMKTSFRERWPGVQIHPRDVAQTAVERDMTEVDVRQTLSLVELFVPNDGTDAYFEVFADNMLVSIPYSHKAPRVDAALRRVWEYLEMFEHDLGCVTFDPQHRRVVDLSLDFDGVKDKYQYLAARSARAEEGEGRSSRWWKLW